MTRNPEWIGDGVYSDYGISGTNQQQRTGYKRLLRHCREEKIDRIVCKSISRFARNTSDFMTAINILHDHHVTILFEKEGLDAYRTYQIEHEEEVLAPGSGFALVKALLHLNALSKERLVEVLILSRNGADTSLRLFHSIEHYGLDITRAVLSGGEGLANYLEAFGVDLFLSADEDDAQAAIDAGFAAGIIFSPQGS